MSFVGLSIGEAAARLVAFATMLVIARRLGPDGLGVVSFAVAILLYLQRFVDAGFDLGIGIREVAARQDRLGRFVGAILAFRLVIATAMIAVALLAVALAPSLESRLVALYALTLVPLAVGTRWVLTGLGLTTPVGVSRATGELVVLLLVILTITGAGDLWRVPLAQLLGDAVAAVVLLVVLRRLGIASRPEWDTTTVRPLVRHIAPYVGSALLGLAIFNSGLLFLRFFHDRATVGLFAAAYSLVSFLINVGAMYALAALAPLTRLAADSSRLQDLYQTSWAMTVVALAPITVGGGMIAAELVASVFSAQFSLAGTVLAVLMLSVPLSVLRSLATSALTAKRREDLMLRTDLVSAMFNITLNLLIVPSFGMFGAAAVTVATELLRLLIAQHHARTLGIRAPNLRRYLKPLAATGVMAAVLATDLAPSPMTAIFLGTVVYVLALFAVRGLVFDTRGWPTLQV